MNFKQLFAKNLRKIRSSKGLSQTDLATKLGVKPQSVSSYEGGENFPTGEKLGKILEILEVTPGELFKDESKVKHSSEVEYSSKEAELLKAAQYRKYVLAEVERIEKEAEPHTEKVKDKNGNYVEVVTSSNQIAKRTLIEHMELEKKSKEELIEVFDFLYQKEILKLIKKF